MQTQPLSHQQTLARIEELRQQNEMMDLSLELAFKEQVYLLLKNKDSDPKIVLEYLKMHERREAQKLKALTAKLKEREIELKEKLAERRQVLEERKQALNERKFDHDTQDLPEDKPLAAPSLAPAARDKAQGGVQPLQTAAGVKSSAARDGSSSEKAPRVGTS
jgi:hypothetical protein